MSCPWARGCLEVIEMAWALDPDSPFLFPSPRSPDQHLDPHAITRAIARTCERKGLPLGSPHDVRRSGATTLTGRYGFSRIIVGLVLGHTPKEGSTVTGVYDRHTYVPEKRKALEVWAAHLCGGAVSGAQDDAGEGAPPEALAAYVEAAKGSAVRRIAVSASRTSARPNDLRSRAATDALMQNARSHTGADSKVGAGQSGLSAGRSGQGGEHGDGFGGLGT